MAEQIPNGLNSDLPMYWKDLSGIDFGIKVDETFYGQTKNYFTTASNANFLLLSEYAWNLGDPCGEGLFGEMSVHLNNFFNLLRGIQGFTNTYIVGSINMVRNLAGEITKISEAIASILRTLIQRVRNWVLNKIRELINAALEAILTPLTKQIKEGVLQIIIQQLVCAFDDIIDGLVDFVGDFLYALLGQVIQAPLCAVENYLNAMLNRLSSDIEAALAPALNSLNDVLGGALSVVGQINSVINQILGFESFFCSRPECPEVKSFKASIWGGPTPSAIADFQNFTAASTSIVSTAQATAEQWLADFFGPTSNSSTSPGPCYTGTFKCGLPQVVIFGGGGSGAVGNAVVNAIGEVIGVNLLNGGSGYKSPPFVSIVDPGGCGLNASARAVLCPKTPTTTSTPAPGYIAPGIYLNLLNASSTPPSLGYSGPGVYLDLTNIPGAVFGDSITVTLTTVQNAASRYVVTIPGSTISGGLIPPLPSPATSGVPVQVAFNLEVGKVYGPITKTSGPGDLYLGDQVIPTIRNSGTLTNSSIVIAEGSDDWDDMVVSTDVGIFAPLTSPPIASTTPSPTVAAGTIIPVLFTRTGSKAGYAINLPTTAGDQTITGPGSPGNTVTGIINLAAGSIYGPLKVASGTGDLYIGNQVVASIPSSGSLTNTSVVVAEGTDDWGDMVLSTSHGFFENYTATPTTTSSSTSSSATTSVCKVIIDNPGGGYSSAANNGAPIIDVFYGTPNPTYENTTITLYWNVSNATKVSLNVSGFDNVPLTGNASVLIGNPLPVGAVRTTVTYTLTAINDQVGTAAQIVTRDFIVTVDKNPGPGGTPSFGPGGTTSAGASPGAPAVNTNTPVINSFTADSTTVGIGSVVNLTWDSTDALFCSLSATGSGYSITGYSSLPEDGTLSFVIPSGITFPAGGGNASFDYTLSATNPNAPVGVQTVTSSLTISVVPPVAAPSITPPTTPTTPPAAGPVGLFTCTPSVTTLNEGDSVDFVVTSLDPADNGTFFYQIVGTSGAITASDFTDNTLTGSFTIAGNTGTITKTIAIDANVESSEQFYMGIKRNATDTTFLTRSEKVTINADAFTPAIAIIGGVTPISTGIGFGPGTTLTTTGGAILKPTISPSGHIVSVSVVDPGYGFTRIPEIEINSRDGLGAKFRVDLDFVPLDEFLKKKKLKSISQDKIVKIIDCVSR